MEEPKTRIAESVDNYLKTSGTHFGKYDPLLFLLSFERGPLHSPASFMMLRQADRFSPDYVQHALNTAGYYHEYRHVWDVFTTLNCLHHALEAVKLNREFSDLVISFSQKGKQIGLPLISRSDPELRNHIQKAKRQTLLEVVSNGFSRLENPALFARLSTHPEEFFPEDTALPAVEECVLGARPILETLGQLWGVSALTFDPELVNTLMERIWWGKETFRESWPYVLILSRFKNALREVGDKVEYGGTIAILDLALQSETEHPGVRLLKILGAIKNEQIGPFPNPTQFQEDLCEKLGWETPRAALSKFLAKLENETQKPSDHYGTIFLNDAAEAIRLRLSQPDTVFKPSIWEEGLLSAGIQRILIEMPSFYAQERIQVLYANPSPRTKSYLEYVIIDHVRRQSYYERRIRCPWAEKSHPVNAQPYDCSEKKLTRCSVSSSGSGRTECLFFDICEHLGFYTPAAT